MTNDPNERGESIALPGVSLSEFDAAVKVLTKLRDEAKYTIMLTRIGAVRTVGAPEDFWQAFSQGANRETDRQAIGKILSEIRNFCQLRVFFPKADQAVEFLTDRLYSDTFEKLDEPNKTTFRDQLIQKLELALGLLPTGYKERQRRLETATGACLDDLDAELVKERRDEYQGVKVDQPFLRLRFRYTAAADELSCLWIGPWGGPKTRPSKSFELECDEVDIDVLMFRLAEAKKMLLSAVEQSEVGTGTGE